VINYFYRFNAATTASFIYFSVVNFSILVVAKPMQLNATNATFGEKCARRKTPFIKASVYGKL